jgi:hypothetical protein
MGVDQGPEPNVPPAGGAEAALEPTIPPPAEGVEEGVVEPEGEVFYRGTHPEGHPNAGKRIDGPFEADRKGKVFAARRRSSARSYGSEIETFTPRPGARILKQEDPAFWEMIGQEPPPNGDIASLPGTLVENVDRAVRLAEEAGYDAISFSRDGDIGTVILNEGAFDRISESQKKTLEALRAPESPVTPTEPETVSEPSEPAISPEAAAESVERSREAAEAAEIPAEAETEVHPELKTPEGEPKPLYHFTRERFSSRPRAYREALLEYDALGEDLEAVQAELEAMREREVSPLDPAFKQKRAESRRLYSEWNRLGRVVADTGFEASRSLMHEKSPSRRRELLSRESLYNMTEEELDALAPDIVSPELGGTTDAGWLGAGAYFVDDPRIFRTGLGKVRYTVHARLKNPFIMGETPWPEGVERVIPRLNPGSFTRALKSAGFDGVISRGKHSTMKDASGIRPATEYVVFDAASLETVEVLDERTGERVALKPKPAPVQEPTRAKKPASEAVSEGGVTTQEDLEATDVPEEGEISEEEFRENPTTEGFFRLPVSLKNRVMEEWAAATGAPPPDRGGTRSPRKPEEERPDPRCR